MFCDFFTLQCCFYLGGKFKKGLYIFCYKCFPTKDNNGR